MSDIALIWSDDNLGDIAIAGSDLQTDAGLQTAVVVSLFTDRRAARDDELPAGETNLRGWWGDVAPEVEGDVIGSRLWLLFREKAISSVLSKAEEYASDALKWLIEDKVASRVDVVAEEIRSGDSPMLALQVTIYRVSGDAVNFKFDYAWQAQARAYQ